MYKRESSAGAAKTLLARPVKSNSNLLSKRESISFNTPKKEFQANINNFRQSLIQNPNNPNFLHFQSNPNINLLTQKKFSIFNSKSIINFSSGTAANRFNFLNNNQIANQNPNNDIKNNESINNNQTPLNTNNFYYNNYINNINNKNNDKNNYKNNNNANLISTNSFNLSQGFNPILVQFGVPMVKKVHFHKKTTSIENEN